MKGKKLPHHLKVAVLKCSGHFGPFVAPEGWAPDTTLIKSLSDHYPVVKRNRRSFLDFREWPPRLP
jgi:hypothetical protein